MEEFSAIFVDSFAPNDSIGHSFRVILIEGDIKLVTLEFPHFRPFEEASQIEMTGAHSDFESF